MKPKGMLISLLFILCAVGAWALIGPENVDRSRNWTWSGTQTFTGATSVGAGSTTTMTWNNEETITNPSDGVLQMNFNDDAVELGKVNVNSTNTATADNDYLVWAFQAKDDGGVATTFASIRAYLDDVTSNTTDAHFSLRAMVADTATTFLNFYSTKIQPETDNSVDLGDSTHEMKDGFFDGTLTADTGQIDENLTVSGTTTSTGAMSAIGGLSVGASGTAVSKVIYGTTTINDNATTKSVSVAGMDSGDIVIVTAQGDMGAATDYSAAPGTGAFILTQSGDAGTNITYAYQAVLLP